MAIIAQWLNKQWEVSPQKIMAFQTINTEYKLKADTNEDSAGQPATNIRRLELQKITFDTQISDIVGVDVEAEITDWKELIGQSAPLLMGGKIFGPEKVMLMSLKVSDLVTDDLGRIRSAKLGFTFQEDAEEPAKTKSSASSAKAKKTSPGISERLSGNGASSATYSALGITAKSSDKETMKPANPQMYAAELS